MMLHYMPCHREVFNLPCLAIRKLLQVRSDNLLPVDMDAHIMIYCRSGSMSSVSANELVQLGYTNIWNLDGGFNAWAQANLPIEQ